MPVLGAFGGASIRSFGVNSSPNYGLSGGSLSYSGAAQDFSMAQLQAYGIGWTPATESFYSLDGNSHTIVITERITNFSGNPNYRETYNQTRVVPSSGTLALGGWIGTPVGIRVTLIT